jgi:hypothetical protein
MSFSDVFSFFFPKPMGHKMTKMCTFVKVTYLFYHNILTRSSGHIKLVVETKIPLVVGTYKVTLHLKLS